ncbi:hypothetical protein LTR17_026649 [Elasticomyces elasticus]|nr:hypothetical protein LTR17_026649 [Elasticomyces elasticus]
MRRVAPRHPPTQAILKIIDHQTANIPHVNFSLATTANVRSVPHAQRFRHPWTAPGIEDLLDTTPNPLHYPYVLDYALNNPTLFSLRLFREFIEMLSTRQAEDIVDQMEAAKNLKLEESPDVDVQSDFNAASTKPQVHGFDSKIARDYLQLARNAIGKQTLLAMQSMNVALTAMSTIHDLRRNATATVEDLRRISGDAIQLPQPGSDTWDFLCAETQGVATLTSTNWWDQYFDPKPAEVPTPVQSQVTAPAQPQVAPETPGEGAAPVQPQVAAPVQPQVALETPGGGTAPAQPQVAEETQGAAPTAEFDPDTGLFRAATAHNAENLLADLNNLLGVKAEDTTSLAGDESAPAQTHPDRAAGITKEAREQNRIKAAQT